jgi:hypothetical protein
MTGKRKGFRWGGIFVEGCDGNMQGAVLIARQLLEVRRMRRGRVSRRGYEKVTSRVKTRTQMEFFGHRIFLGFAGSQVCSCQRHPTRFSSRFA